MAAASLGSRLAQKLISQQLSGIGGKGISAAQKVGAGAAAVAGKKVPRFAGSKLASRILEEAVTTGTVMGGAALLGSAADALFQPQVKSAASAYSLPIQQQYEAASALEQQKFEHQMAVIQARQMASADRAAYGMTPNMVDPMSIANQLFKAQEY
jgi:hypothetical protein